MLFFLPLALLLGTLWVTWFLLYLFAIVPFVCIFRASQGEDPVPPALRAYWHAIQSYCCCGRGAQQNPTCDGSARTELQDAWLQQYLEVIEANQEAQTATTTIQPVVEDDTTAVLVDIEAGNAGDSQG